MLAGGCICVIAFKESVKFLPCLFRNETHSRKTHIYEIRIILISTVVTTIVGVENTIFLTICYNSELIHTIINRISILIIPLYIIDIRGHPFLLRFGEIKTDTEDSAGRS